MMNMAPFSFGRTPQGIKWLLAAIGIVFIFQQFLSGWFEFTFGLVPYKVITRFHLWQLFTYQFIHGSFFHILFNCFALWMFGKELENTWGTKEFLKFYFICGTGAALTNTLFEPFSLIPIIGASGAIYGILVAFAVTYPTAVIYVYGLIPLQAKHFVLLIGVIEFFASFDGGTSMIARFAHLGGMLTGYLYLKSYEFRSVLNRFFNGLVNHLTVKKTKIRKERKPAKEDLVREVDRILEKVLIHGADSLTEKERELMRRYSSMKRH